MVRQVYQRWLFAATAVLALGLTVVDGARSTEPTQTLPGAGSGPKTSASVVQATASADKPAANGVQVVNVHLALAKDKPWHVYGNPLPKEFPGVPTTIMVEPKVKSEDVRVDYPQGKLVKDADYGDHQIYEGQADIEVTVRRPSGDAGPLQLKVKFQACYEITEQGKNLDGRCLPPSVVTLSVP